jgi:hypothetical protein
MEPQGEQPVEQAVSDNGGSHVDSLEEAARRQNSTLQSLIEVVSNSLAASRALLARLQGSLARVSSGGRPAPMPDELPEHPAVDEGQQAASAMAPDSHNPHST